MPFYKYYILFFIHFFLIGMEKEAPNTVKLLIEKLYQYSTQQEIRDKLLLNAGFLKHIWGYAQQDITKEHIPVKQKSSLIFSGCSIHSDYYFPSTAFLDQCDLMNIQKKYNLFLETYEIRPSLDQPLYLPISPAQIKECSKKIDNEDCYEHRYAFSTMPYILGWCGDEYYKGKEYLEKRCKFKLTATGPTHNGSWAVGYYTHPNYFSHIYFTFKDKIHPKQIKTQIDSAITACAINSKDTLIVCNTIKKPIAKTDTVTPYEIAFYTLDTTKCIEKWDSAYNDCTLKKIHSASLPEKCIALSCISAGTILALSKLGTVYSIALKKQDNGSMQANIYKQTIKDKDGNELYVKKISVHKDKPWQIAFITHSHKLYLADLKAPHPDNKVRFQLIDDIGAYKTPFTNDIHYWAHVLSVSLNKYPSFEDFSYKHLDSISKCSEPVLSIAQNIAKDYLWFEKNQIIYKQVPCNIESIENNYFFKYFAQDTDKLFKNQPIIMHRYTIQPSLPLHTDTR